MFTDDSTPAIQENGSQRPGMFQEGMIPVGFGHSSHGDYHVSAPPGNSSIHKETGDGPSLKGKEGSLQEHLPGALAH